MQVSVSIELKGEFENLLSQVSEALKVEGFGLLTRIDFHKKIEEKLGQKIPATIILGACHPGLAFEAVQINPAVVNLMPCNVVFQETSPANWKIEFALAEPLLSILSDEKLQKFAKGVDQKIKNAVEALKNKVLRI